LPGKLVEPKRTLMLYEAEGLFSFINCLLLVSNYAASDLIVTGLS
jgi:hypothetical protein